MRSWGAAIALLAAMAAAQAGERPASPEACPAQVIALLAGTAGLPQAAPVAQACRVWPFDRARLLAAVAYPADPAAAPGERDLQLVVAMLDAHDGRLLASHASGLQEDAALELDADGLRLDTARYDLAQGARAFGVRMHSVARGASCPDARGNDTLTLYLPDGATLRPVFSADMQLWSRIAGEPCSWGSGQRVITETATLTVGIAPGARHGLADLRVTADVERVKRAAGADQAQVSQRRHSRVLHYDGNRYDTAPLRSTSFPTSAPMD